MGSLAALQGCGGDDDDGGDGGSETGGEAGESSGGSTGGNQTGGRGGSTGGSTTGGTNTGGSTTGGAGGAPGGMGGDDSVGGEGGGSGDVEREFACTSYCDAYFLNMCDTFDSNTYSNRNDCQSTCEDSSWEIGVAGPGDTINCRLGNALLAVGAEQETRCEYASEESSVCM
jgi:hypothetical protein